MNPSAALAFPLLAVVLWLLTRRRPQASQLAAAALTAPAGLVRTSSAGESAAAPGAAAVGMAGIKSPLVIRGRQQRLNALSHQLNGSREQRLLALEHLAQWGDRCSLPLLQRGLRDPHPEVVRAAAVAIERFRGRTASTVDFGASAPLRLPRNSSQVRRSSLRMR